MKIVELVGQLVKERDEAIVQRDKAIMQRDEARRIYAGAVASAREARSELEGIHYRSRDCVACGHCSICGKKH
jgi:ferredoxin-like protein FixX